MRGGSPCSARLPTWCQVRPPSFVASTSPFDASTNPPLGETKLAATAAADGADASVAVVVVGAATVVVVVSVRRRVVVVVVARDGAPTVVVVLVAVDVPLEQPAIATMPTTIAATLVLRPCVFMEVSLSARSPRRRGS